MCARYIKYFHGYVLDVVMEYTSSICHAKFLMCSLMSMSLLSFSLLSLLLLSKVKKSTHFNHDKE